MKRKSIIALLLALVMALALTACQKTPPADQPSMTREEVEAQIESKLDELNNVLEEHEDLWNRLFAQEDDTVNRVYDDDDDGSIYSGYLTAAMEQNKTLFSEEELNTMRGDVEKIRKIEAELLTLEDQRQQLLGPEGEVSNPTAEFFPAFEGKDLDGSDVSSELFKSNKVTVVNFWFSTCSPCIGELDKLNALNEQLKEKGGAVIGINVDTLYGDEAQIAEAKKILAQKGAVYQNIRFDSSSEAGKFAGEILGFPTTYVVDGDGRIVGEPLMGGIDYPGIMEQLQVQIAQALGEDTIPYNGADGVNP